MKYLIKFIAEWQTEVDTGSTEQAAAHARLMLQQMPTGTKLLGVVREDIGWPDLSAEIRPTPPRGRPPSGTPGTPTAPALHDQVEEFLFTEKAA